MTVLTAGEEVCCLFCKATPEQAALCSEGPVLVCVSDAECTGRWASRHQALEAAALVVKAERG